MKIYLASRYSRRLELYAYRNRIHALGDGFKVQATWLDGNKQLDANGNPIGEHGVMLAEKDLEAGDNQAAFLLRQHFAEVDWRDVQACDLLIAFTEPPVFLFARGGRHVELGMAIALRKSVWVIGHRENIFCYLPQVTFFEDFDKALAYLPILNKMQTAWEQACKF